MGIRPSSFRRGGGFLNEVTGVITNYQVSDAFNGVPYVAGKIKTKDGRTIDRPHSLNLALSFRVDGAEEDVTTTLKVAGDADQWAVSDDGYVVWDAAYDTPEAAADAEEDDPKSVRQIGPSSQIGKFISSLCNPAEGDLKFPEALLSEHNIDLRGAIGTRVELHQAQYTAEELAQVRKLGASDKRSGKNGKEYDRTNLLVKRVLELPQQRKAAAPSKSASRTNGSGKAAVPEVEDVKTIAKRGLEEILKAAGGNITKAKLSVKVLMTPLLKGHPQQTIIRDLYAEDDYLDELKAEGFIGYNKKTGAISLEA